VTWSIIARDAPTGKFGIAVATKFFAVGALVPHLQAGVGAVATQALVNPFLGVNGLKLLREGKSAAEVVQALVAADQGRDHRQVHVMDVAGRTAAHTGTACIDWCGHRAGADVSLALCGEHLPAGSGDRHRLAGLTLLALLDQAPAEAPAPAPEPGSSLLEVVP